MKEAYNIGLDIGTSSVGYAMTDEKGRLLRFHKRPTYVRFCLRKRRRRKNVARSVQRGVGWHVGTSVSNCCKHWLRRMCVRQTQRFFFG